MQWWKKLSLSDARQKTGGGLMPFRFTSENCPGNFVTWFKDVFFGELEWGGAIQMGRQIEEAHIGISVNIDGEDLGQRIMRVTHDEQRNKNNGAPTTHLNFDEATNEYLRSNDMTGKYIVFSKGLAGDFHLIIQDEPPQ